MPADSTNTCPECGSRLLRFGGGLWRCPECNCNNYNSHRHKRTGTKPESQTNGPENHPNVGHTKPESEVTLEIGKVEWQESDLPKDPEGKTISLPNPSSPEQWTIRVCTNCRKLMIQASRDHGDVCSCPWPKRHEYITVCRATELARVEGQREKLDELCQGYAYDAEKAKHQARKDRAARDAALQLLRELLEAIDKRFAAWRKETGGASQRSYDAELGSKGMSEKRITGGFRPPSMSYEEWAG